MDILFAELETGLAGVNWNTVILTALGIVGTSITSVLAIYLVKVNANAKKAIEGNDEIRKAVVFDAPKQLGEIHVAVNSTKAKLEDEIKALHAEVLIISKDNSALKQELMSSRVHQKEVVIQPVARLTDSQLFQMIQDLSQELGLRKKNGKGQGL